MHRHAVDRRKSVEQIGLQPLYVREHLCGVRQCAYRGAESGNLKALRTLPAAKLSILPGGKSQKLAETLLARQENTGQVTKTPQNVTCLKTWTLRNDSDVPALLIRLILKDRRGEEILPVDYSDNYFALMPGEEKTVTVRWRGTPDAHIDVTQLN